MLGLGEPNALMQPPRGERWGDSWEEFLDRVWLASTGEPGMGLPQIYTQWDGTSAANIFSSADTTNGIGIDASSQDDSHRLVIRNSGNDLTGSTVLDGTLEVTGPTLLGDTLDVVGDAALQGTLTVDGATLLGSTLGVTGATTLSSTLAVTGATTLGSTLGVTGIATFLALLNADDGIDVGNGNFTVDADGNFNAGGGNITGDASSGDMVIGGTLGVTGVATLSNDLVVGTTDLVVDVSANKVGIGAVPVSTDAMLTVAGTIASTGVGAPTTNANQIFMHQSGANGFIRVQNPGAGTYPGLLVLDALALQIRTSNVVNLSLTGTQFGIFGTAATQPAGGAATADLTWSSNERDMLNTLWSMARGYGFIT